MVRGSCPVCHPSGGVSLVLQRLVGARWSFSGHPTCVFSFLIARFVLASASTRRFGYSMLVFSWLSFWERGGLSFAFVTVFVMMCSGLSLAPRLAGFTVLARPTRDNLNGRLLYPVRAVRSSWSAWAAHHRRCVPFILPQVVA